MNEIVNRKPNLDAYTDVMDNDAPRYLYGGEKEEILDVINSEAIYIIHKDIRVLLLQQQKNHMRLQLEDVQLCPSLIPNMKGHYINRHVRAIADPNEPVGFNAAEGVNAPLV